MPNGRLSRCVIGGRKSADLYQNTSGNAASVSLFANAISTNTNSEMTVVVGIASTTLSQLTTVISAPVGTFCSMTSPHYYSGNGTAESVGSASTYIGFSVPPTEEYNQPSSSCSPGVAGADHLQVASLPVYVDTYGCRTNEQPDQAYKNTQYYICMCENTCIYGKSYGGNEIHNPSVWMREYPAMHHNCCGGDYFWAGKIIGFFDNTCCACCWHPCSACVGNAATRYPLTARHVGMGNSANARQSALQRMINWCCCCGCIGDSSVDSGMAPITAFSGCTSTTGCACRWGTHCAIQHCVQCAPCCCAGMGQKMWNWYTLDRGEQCCSSGASFNNGWQMYKCCFANACATNVDEGVIKTPQWMSWGWCCNNACGCIQDGYIIIRNTFNCRCCGCTCWYVEENLRMSSCCNEGNWMCQIAKCYCRPCIAGYMKADNATTQCKMSPYGFAYGMTNCSMMIWGGTGSSGGNPLCHEYLLSFPNLCYVRCCPGSGPCYLFQRYRLDIHHAPNAAGYCYEFPVKYLAWNCFKENKCGTMGCTYIMIRSITDSHCGIFSLDANDMRISHGPFCGCATEVYMCCNAICEQMCFSPDGKLTDGTCPAGGPTGNGAQLTKVASFPTDMASTNYSDNAKCVMCTTCLFRADFCTWTMSLWNYQSQTWDGFQTNDLISWSKISDPYSVKINNLLTRIVSSDYACIVDDCNCYFANIDCSGIIDYKLSVNQYERTGIVLSDGDRLMVNNDADVCLSFQVWGYEG